MAILQTLLTLALKRVGRVLNTLFGWATMLLFGKVPEKRQMYLSAIALGSVLWLVVVIGTIVPSVGTFLLAFVKLPDSVEPMWVRLAMLSATIILPLIVGAGSLLLVDSEDRPHGTKEIATAVLKGYPYTIGLAVTLVMMLVIAPLLKLQNLWRRWQSNHVAVIVQAEDYKEVVSDLQHILWRAGIQTRPAAAGPLLRWPTKVFTWFVGGAVEDLVADELSVLKAHDFELLIHPSDLLLSGRQDRLMQAYAAITEQLVFTKCYMTWSKETNEIEDRFERLLKSDHPRLPRIVFAELGEIVRDMKQVKVSDKEWDVLLRVKLQTERELLRHLAGIAEDDREQVLAERESEVALNSKSPQTRLQGGSRRILVNTTAAILGVIAWLRRGRTKNVS